MVIIIRLSCCNHVIIYSLYIGMTHLPPIFSNIFICTYSRISIISEKLEGLKRLLCKEIVSIYVGQRCILSVYVFNFSICTTNARVYFAKYIRMDLLRNTLWRSLKEMQPIVPIKYLSNFWKYRTENCVLFITRFFFLLLNYNTYTLLYLQTEKIKLYVIFRIHYLPKNIVTFLVTSWDIFRTSNNWKCCYILITI